MVGIISTLCLCASVPLGLVPSAGAAETKFTAKPTAAKAADGKVKIEFAVDCETDVAVFVEDGGGKIVRHLVAGVLGKNPPAPLKPGLAQNIEWDGLADYGKPAGAGPFKVRVAIGLGARYDKVLLSDSLSVGGFYCIGVGPDGTVYLRMGTGTSGWNGAQIIALNRDGSYQRMVSPFASNLKSDRVKSFETFELEGRPAPLVHAIQQLNLYPAPHGPRKSTMGVTAKGELLMLVGGEYGAGPLRMAALDAEGGCPWNKYTGPDLLAGAGVDARSFVTASSDGQYVYVSGLKANKSPLSALYRVKLPERGPAEPFFGDPNKTGNDESHLGGVPAGLALDGKGNLLVADPANNRVVIVSEKDGKFVGSFSTDAPDCLGIDQASGAVYVSRMTGKGNVELVKLSGVREPRELARMPLAANGNPAFPWLMAVDGNARPPIVWMAGDYGRLLRIEDSGGKLEPREIGNNNLGDCAFLDVYVDRWRKEVFVRRAVNPGTSTTWLRYGEEADAWDKVQAGPHSSSSGVQLVTGPDGSLYLPSYVNGIYKFDRSGKPSSWTNPRQDPDGRVKNPSHALFTPVSETWLQHRICVREDGHVFTFEPGKNGNRPPRMLREYLPSGELAREDPIIWMVSDGSVGPKFDPQGNIYIAEIVRPQDQPYPPEFSKIFEKLEVNKQRPAGGSLQDNVANMYGSIVKFSPKGGMVHFDGPGGDRNVGERPFKGEPKLDPSLKSMDAAYYYQYKFRPVKITGAEWIRMGVSHVEVRECTCQSTRFDVDEFGRVFYPDMQRFRVAVLDTNGNEIAHFGGYGNAESRGPDSPVIDPQTGKVRPRRTDDPKDLKSPFAEPEIAFSWLSGVGVTDRYVYTGDSLNRRLLRSRIVYASEESCEVK